MRRVRAAIAVLIALLGTVIALAAVLAEPGQDDALTPILLVLTGILLVEAASWKRANPFLPSERKNYGLRAEVDAFLRMVKRLDRVASLDDPNPAQEALRRALVEEMKESVDRMDKLAGEPSAAARATRLRRAMGSR